MVSDGQCGNSNCTQTNSKHAELADELRGNVTTREFSSPLRGCCSDWPTRLNAPDVSKSDPLERTLQRPSLKPSQAGDLRITSIDANLE
jgi:hypothetical protein